MLKPRLPTGARQMLSSRMGAEVELGAQHSLCSEGGCPAAPFL